MAVYKYKFLHEKLQPLFGSVACIVADYASKFRRPKWGDGRYRKPKHIVEVLEFKTGTHYFRRNLEIVLALHEPDFIANFDIWDVGTDTVLKDIENCSCGHALTHNVKIKHTRHGSEIIIGNTCKEKFDDGIRNAYKHAVRIFKDPNYTVCLECKRTIGKNYREKAKRLGGYHAKCNPFKNLIKAYGEECFKQIKQCRQCKSPFYQTHKWKRICLPCWKINKR